jgi:hypothetical protein
VRLHNCIAFCASAHFFVPRPKLKPRPGLKPRPEFKHRAPPRLAKIADLGSARSAADANTAAAAGHALAANGGGRAAGAPAGAAGAGPVGARGGAADVSMDEAAAGIAAFAISKDAPPGGGGRGELDHMRHSDSFMCEATPPSRSELFARCGWRRLA